MRCGRRWGRAGKPGKLERLLRVAGRGYSRRSWRKSDLNWLQVGARPRSPQRASVAAAWPPCSSAGSYGAFHRAASQLSVISIHSDGLQALHAATTTLAPRLCSAAATNAAAALASFIDARPGQAAAGRRRSARRPPRSRAAGRCRGPGLPGASPGGLMGRMGGPGACRMPRLGTGAAPRRM